MCPPAVVDIRWVVSSTDTACAYAVSGTDIASAYTKSGTDLAGAFVPGWSVGPFFPALRLRAAATRVHVIQVYQEHGCGHVGRSHLLFRCRNQTHKKILPVTPRKGRILFTSIGSYIFRVDARY